MFPTTSYVWRILPDADADWKALRFDGYRCWGSFEDCARIALRGNPRTLTELRTCLCFEQRRLRMTCVVTREDEDLASVYALIRRIRDSLATSE